jgi:hypothetical protein
MKKSTLIASLLVSMALLALISVPRHTDAQVQSATLFMYAAKFICGKDEGRILSPGQYFTAVNVHNASPVKPATYIKRFAVALPSERPGPISPFARGVLKPDEAMTIECENIIKHTGITPAPLLEGFALIYSLQELDVVPVYTAGHSEVEALHSERVPARRLVLPATHAITRQLREQQ